MDLLTIEEAVHQVRRNLVFNAKDYGATGDGTTDDRSAIENCIAAAVATINSSGKGATVYLPAGVYAITSVAANPPTNPSTGSAYGNTIGIGLPVNLTAKLTIRGDGRGATTIKLSTNARCAFWINQAADYDTFKNVTLEDFDVDNNNTTGRSHVVVGSMPNANTSQRRLNYADLTVRRINIYNVPNDITGATSSKSHVLFLGSHPAALEATQTSSQRILVEDMRMLDGANGVVVASWGAGSLVGGTNHYYDQIKVRRCSHEISVTPTATAGQTSFYVCGTGFGDYFEIIDCYSKNSADDGLEIGAMQTGLIDRVRIVDPFLVGILFRHTHAATSVATQKIAVRETRVDVTSALAAVSGAIGRPVTWLGDNSLTLGSYDIRGFTWSGDGLTYSKQAQADIALKLDAPVADITFTGLRLVLTNYTVDSGSGTVNGTLILMNQASGKVTIRDLSIVAAITASAGSGLTYQFHAISHGGPGTANEFYVDGYTLDYTGTSWTNSTGGSITGFGIARSGGAFIKGHLRRFTPIGPTASISGVGARAITVLSSATIGNYEITDCDLTGWPNLAAGRDIDASVTNMAKILVRDVIGHDGVRLGPGGRRAVSASYTVLSADAATIGVTSTSSARTITLPAANTFPPGQLLIVKDESGAAATNNITVARAGSDTIDGATSAVISANYGVTSLYSDGSSKWFTA